jgi:hypothetical protein
VVNSKADIPEGQEEKFITKADDYKLRTKAVNDNAKLVTEFFMARIDAFHEKVLKPFFGVKEYVVR